MELTPRFTITGGYIPDSHYPLRFFRERKMIWGELCMSVSQQSIKGYVKMSFSRNRPPTCLLNLPILQIVPFTVSEKSIYCKQLMP